MMTSSELNEHFGLEGVLRFEDHGALVRAMITLPACTATVYLQGAHLAHWQPTGQAPVLFLSEHSSYVPGKAIRGGIPICFPWFGNRSDGGPGPAHGFARTQPWELAFAALVTGSGQGDALQMTFVLGATDLSESLGFEGFRVAYELLLGRTLKLKLTVANFSNGPLRFEEALHTYLHVQDVHQAPITGLEDAPYLDKRDDSRLKAAPAGPLQLVEFSDRVFAGSKANTRIDDKGNHRTLHIDKDHSATTIVWNPWPEGSAPLKDLGPDEWPSFLCVETANTGTDAITLAPGQTHTMNLALSVKPTS
jgi:glucose-6-phosphate 1-epimerase